MFSLCVWRRKINLVCWHRAWLRSPLLAASVFEVFGEETGQLTASLRLVSSVQRLLSAYTHTHTEGERIVHTHAQSPEEQWQMPPVWPESVSAMQRLSDSLTEPPRICGWITLQHTSNWPDREAYTGYRDSCSLLRHSNWLSPDC